ncbi:VOC family protein [Natrarchaeobius sp. A-rgal3]|uniref:VOC family protein n=1 Tax=Natrarchaeobius versutus TaxID=1679078 RepID=UPI00350EC764
MIDVSDLDVELPELSQIGIVVEDLADGMDRFGAMLGVEPWHVYRFEPPELAEATYRGEETHQSWRLALASVGDVDLELIEPLEGENTYTAHLEEHGEGIHHVACYAFEDPRVVVERYEDAGIPVLQSGVYQGGPFWYLDTREEMNGVVLEVVDLPEDGPESDRTYAPD